MNFSEILTRNIMFCPERSFRRLMCQESTVPKNTKKEKLDPQRFKTITLEESKKYMKSE
ncbi:MAG: hypothetical protein MHPSP_004445, partial [Paramarteilia canceri]